MLVTSKFWPEILENDESDAETMPQTPEDENSWLKDIVKEAYQLSIDREG